MSVCVSEREGVCEYVCEWEPKEEDTNLSGSENMIFVRGPIKMKHTAPVTLEDLAAFHCPHRRK